MALREQPLLLAAALLLAPLACRGCVYLLGEALDSLASHTGTHWSYGFKGDDWADSAWACSTGTRQSPINVHNVGTLPKGSSSVKTIWSYTPLVSNGSNIQVWNNGHTIQVQWVGSLTSNVRVATGGNHVQDLFLKNITDSTAAGFKRIQATPLQFHFHADSEHMIEGVYYPLEMHIVHNVPQSVLPGCPTGGCYMVTGMVFKVVEEDNPVLDDIFSIMPIREGAMTYMPKGVTLDLQKLLPETKSYVQYQGSLTTPPCTEGLLWHVMLKPLGISMRQLREYQEAVGLKECNSTTTAHRHRRHLHAHDHHEHDHAHMTDKEVAQSDLSVPLGKLSKSKSATGRTLLATETSSSSWTCEVVAYGWTNRLPQPNNNRAQKLYI